MLLIHKPFEVKGKLMILHVINKVVLFLGLGSPLLSDECLNVLSKVRAGFRQIMERRNVTLGDIDMIAWMRINILP